MLRGDEHFFPAWSEMVGSVVERGPVVDLGSPAPFQKEMAAIGQRSLDAYFVVDYVPSPSVHVVADAHALPFRNGSLGGVLCSHLLEHVVDPRRVIEEVRRALVPGGRAYLSFLVDWPYHASPGVYPDLWRFKKDTIDLLLAPWSKYDALRGGGPIQVLINHVPARLRWVLQRLANRFDRRTSRSATPAYYVVAER